MSMSSNPLLQKSSVQEPFRSEPPRQERASSVGFPPFRPLAATAFAANVPVLSWLLLIGRLESALSLSAGIVVGFALYGSLHLFVGRGLEPLFAGIRGQAKPSLGGAKTLFVALLPLKYLVIGGLMFLLIRGGHLSLLWLIVGFLVTQISITAAAVSHIAKQGHQQSRRF